MHMTQRALLVILDGLGDRPVAAFNGATPLEAASTPNLDRLVAEGQCGLVDPVVPGFPASTHNGTAVLLGVAPGETDRLARGPVEAAGIGLALSPGEVAVRCNFATVEQRDGGLYVLDRRAGRIREHTDELASSLRNVPLGDGISGDLYPASQHRAVLRLTGPGLSGQVSDADPGDRVPIPTLVPQSAPLHTDDVEAARTADALNRFVQIAYERLHDHPVNVRRRAENLAPATGIIAREAGSTTPVRSVITELGLGVAIVAGECTLHGMGRLLGCTVESDPRFTALPDTDLEAKVTTARRALATHDLVILHVKGTDTASHDRNPQAKREMLERFDAALGTLLDGNIVVAVGADHSTDSSIGVHIGDPVPALLYNPRGRRDRATAFGETDCMQGGLGRISGFTFVLSLIDAMGHLDNLKVPEWQRLAPGRHTG